MEFLERGKIAARACLVDLAYYVLGIVVVEVALVMCLVMHAVDHPELFLHT